MDELFEEHLEIAKALFAQRLPYWCDVFLRPADQAFNAYLNARGQASTYLVLEGFDPVYVPRGCDLDAVRATARARARLREAGLGEDALPVLLRAQAASIAEASAGNFSHRTVRQRKAT